MQGTRFTGWGTEAPRGGPIWDHPPFGRMLACMNASTQMALKLGIVGVTVIGIFLLAALGRIDAADSLHDIVIVVGGLVLALGISGGLANGAEKLVQGQTPETGPAVVVTQSLAPAAKAMFPSKPPANERGFVHLRSLAAVLGLGVILVGATGATCTPSQVVQAIVTVAVDACQEAPQLIPPGTTAEVDKYLNIIIHVRA